MINETILKDNLKRRSLVIRNYAGISTSVTDKMQYIKHAHKKKSIFSGGAGDSESSWRCTWLKKHLAKQVLWLVTAGKTGFSTTC